MEIEILQSILSELQKISKALEPEVRPCPSNEQCQSWIADQLDGEELKTAQKTKITTGTAIGQCGTSSTAAQKPKWPESVDDLPDRSYVSVYVPTEKYDSFSALSALYILRQAYRGDWKPDWTDAEQDKHTIVFEVNKPVLNCNYLTQQFLAFETREQAQHFLKHHRALIKQAGELL